MKFKEAYTDKNCELKIGIIGLGLIGGSLLKALKLKGNYTNITAVDINEVERLIISLIKKEW